MVLQSHLFDRVIIHGLPIGCKPCFVSSAHALNLRLSSHLHILRQMAISSSYRLCTPSNSLNCPQLDRFFPLFDCIGVSWQVFEQVIEETQLICVSSFELCQAFRGFVAFVELTCVSSDRRNVSVYVVLEIDFVFLFQLLGNVKLFIKLSHFIVNNFLFH